MNEYKFQRNVKYIDNTLQKWKITGLDKRIFKRKIVNIILAYVLGAQKNDFFENVLLSTHNICFG